MSEFDASKLEEDVGSAESAGEYTQIPTSYLKVALHAHDEESRFGSVIEVTPRWVWSSDGYVMAGVKHNRRGQVAAELTAMEAEWAVGEGKEVRIRAGKLTALKGRKLEPVDSAPGANMPATIDVLCDRMVSVRGSRITRFSVDLMARIVKAAKAAGLDELSVHWPDSESGPIQLVGTDSEGAEVVLAVAPRVKP